MPQESPPSGRRLLSVSQGPVRFTSHNSYNRSSLLSRCDSTATQAFRARRTLKDALVQFQDRRRTTVIAPEATGLDARHDAAYASFADYETEDNLLGGWSDTILVTIVISSVIVEALGTIPYVQEHAVWNTSFRVADYLFSIFFSWEYLLRLYIAKEPLEYIFSFYGITDLLSALPLVIQSLVAACNAYSSEDHGVIFNFMQVMRLFRTVRMFKLLCYVHEADLLVKSLQSRKTFVFIFVFTFISMLLSPVMYVIEGGHDKFDSIPTCLWWTMVTISTVGYGDVVPATPVGKAFGILIILFGYGAIASQSVMTEHDHQSQDLAEAGPGGKMTWRGGSWGQFGSLDRIASDRGSTAPATKLEELKTACEELQPSERAELLAYLAKLLASDVAQPYDRDDQSEDRASTQ